MVGKNTPVVVSHFRGSIHELRSVPDASLAAGETVLVDCMGAKGVVGWGIGFRWGI